MFQGRPSVGGSDYSTNAEARTPRFLTVEEAAAILRIGRTSAYELARRYVATEGREGLPVVRLGRSLRVPELAIYRMAEQVAPDPAA